MVSLSGQFAMRICQLIINYIKKNIKLFGEVQRHKKDKSPYILCINIFSELRV